MDHRLRRVPLLGQDDRKTPGLQGRTDDLLKQIERGCGGEIPPFALLSIVTRGGDAG
jgi:hypothetical protein